MSSLLLWSCLGISCGLFERPVQAPAVTLQDAITLLKADGWTLMTRPDQEAAAAHCVEAAKDHVQGKACLYSCEQRELFEIAQEPGYLYIVGQTMLPSGAETCGHYWTFHGSPSIRSTVGGSWFVETREKMRKKEGG